MSFDLNKAKANEERVCQLLNNYDNSNFKLHPNPNSHYDINGYSDDIPTVVEVKERGKEFPMWWIETKKVRDIIKQLKAEGKDPKEVNAYLVISCNGKDLMYDLKEISKGRSIDKYMNKTTAKDIRGSGTKVKKEVYQFNYNDYIIELNTKQLGYKYE